MYTIDQQMRDYVQFYTAAMQALLTETNERSPEDISAEASEHAAVACDKVVSFWKDHVDIEEL